VVVDDGRLVWREHDDPAPGDTELLVAVQAAGINNADLLQRVGLYPAPPGSPPDIPGMELAGEVVATGRAVTRFVVGDRVMGVVGGGAQAELARIEEDHALAVPPNTGWTEAGGFAEVFETAHDALFTRADLKMGDRVLITGAAGGVGTAAVQLARATGSHVVASARDRERHDELRALGADAAVTPDEVGAHGPYDVVLELVGAASLPDAFGALAPEGRVAVIGVGGGSRIELDLLQLMGRRASIHGATLRARDRIAKAEVARAVAAHVVPLLEAGTVTVPVHATYPMADAETAYEAFATGGKLGKIVLTA
jgi:NADPH:quinone reductase-like Zn-dependent oxidoreductase